MVFALTLFYDQIVYKRYFLNSIHYSYSLIELFIKIITLFTSLHL